MHHGDISPADISRDHISPAIRLPPREEVAWRWGEVCPLLERATRHTSGCYEPEDVLAEIMRGECAIWFIESGSRLAAVVVTREYLTPRKRLFLIHFVAGRGLADWWPEFVERMDVAARHAGCAGIFAHARPGWVRFWKARGVAVHVASEIMVREL